MTQEFEGRVAVVTGASRGIGYQLAKALGARGAHVIAVARTVGGLEDLDDEIKAAGGQATLVPVDITDFDALDRLGAAIFERWKKLDILVGNAGSFSLLSPVGHIAIKDFDTLMATNVTANWRLIPLARSAAAPVGRRTGLVPDRLPCPQLHGLLGPAGGLQGGSGSAGAHICQRKPEDQPEDQPGRSGTGPDRATGQGNAR